MSFRLSARRRRRPRFARRLAVGTAAGCMLAGVGTLAPAAQASQRGYAIELAAYKQMAQVKRSAVVASVNVAVSRYSSCLGPWMSNVAAEYNQGTLPAGGDAIAGIDQMSWEAQTMVDFAAVQPFININAAFLRAELNAHQFGRAAARLANARLTVYGQMEAVNVCADANSWLSEGLTDAEASQFDTRVFNLSLQVHTIDTNPQVSLTLTQSLRIDGLEDTAGLHWITWPGQLSPAYDTTFNNLANQYVDSLS